MTEHTIDSVSGDESTTATDTATSVEIDIDAFDAVMDEYEQEYAQAKKEKGGRPIAKKPKSHKIQTRLNDEEHEVFLARKALLRIETDAQAARWMLTKGKTEETVKREVKRKKKGEEYIELSRLNANLNKSLTLSYINLPSDILDDIKQALAWIDEIRRSKL